MSILFVLVLLKTAQLTEISKKLGKNMPKQKTLCHKEHYQL